MKNLTIRLKITIWYAALLLLLLFLFNFLIYTTISRILEQSTEDLLKEDARQVFSIIQSGGYKINFEVPYIIIATNTYFVLFDANGNTGLKSEIIPEIVSLPIEQEQIRNISAEKTNWLVFDTPITFNDDIIGWIRVSRSLDSLSDTLKNLRILMFVSVPFYLIIATIGGFFLSGRALSPIDRITKTAREISKGDITRRLKMDKSNDEVGRLAATFDDMLDKLENSIKKERQFASDASHELRTPVAVIAAQSEQALSGVRKTREYKEALKLIREESRKMSHIISQLLMIYRNQEEGYKFDDEILDVNLILKEIIQEFANISKGKKVKLRFSPGDNINVKADQTLITRLFINMIDNALRYTESGGEVTIKTLTDKENAVIVISDTGIGISKEDLPYIFDRFFRAEKSRGNNGTGLGLAISKWIVDYNKGEINVESSPGKGSVFTIRLLLYK